MPHHPPHGVTPLDTARRTRNRAAVATTSAAVTALTAFGYLPTVDGIAAALTVVVLGISTAAFGGALTIATRAVFDVIDRKPDTDRTPIG